jgi:hypothetical protein
MAKLVGLFLLLVCVHQLYGMEIIQVSKKKSLCYHMHYKKGPEGMPSWVTPIILKHGNITDAHTDAIFVGAREQAKINAQYIMYIKERPGTLTSKGINKKVKIQIEEGIVKEEIFEGFLIEGVEPYDNFGSGDTQWALFNLYFQTLNIVGHKKQSMEQNINIAFPPISVMHGCPCEITAGAAIKAITCFLNTRPTKFEKIYLMSPTKEIFNTYKEMLNKYFGNGTEETLVKS